MTGRIGAVIAAGGSSSRMNGPDKMFARIGGIPVIARACLAFEANGNVSEIVVVAKSDNVAAVREILDGCGISKLKAVVAGGETRTESVRNGVNRLSDCEYIAIHDGARPFVSQKLINECAETAYEHGSAVPVIPSFDTLKTVSDGVVTGTVDRSAVYRVQTPQIFKTELYVKALDKFADSGFTDDCAMLEEAGENVAVCGGDEENIKITVPSDLKYGTFLAEGDNKVIRTGFGYDVHRLVEGRKLILCGVDVPFEKGLLGHSDADVALHALMDALLGAAALGDIGKFFPDNDEKYAGISSIKLLETVVDNLASNKYTIHSIDITIVAQRPKICSYIDEMRRNVAFACRIDVGFVSVKATTEEGLGFTGAGDGISAYAVCSISK
ncbi:MAG: 2-C-methyl-D-erythritol 2,4-cyclodiphosphate synthase [Clostridia bacterium]|nr:2-C-methyl-D-erythritol 2,4-cyclodiphosphate synthase [Clostridia bacterium]